MSIEKVINTAKEVVTNDKLQNAVAAMINKSIAAFEAGADFLSEQIPDILHQLLLWHAFHSALLCILGISLMIVVVVLELKVGRKVYTLCLKEDDTFPFWFGYVCAGTIIRVPLWLWMLGFLNLTWLQIWIAPKVWLIEYASKLIK